MTNQDAEYIIMVGEFRRFATKQASSLADQVELGVKARTWRGLDVEGNVFHALEDKYKKWKNKVKPGLPILFFSREMVNSIRGKVEIKAVGKDGVQATYNTEIPPGNKYAKYKQWVHEEEGIHRNDVAYPILRKFSAVSKVQQKELDATFEKELMEWVLANVKAE